MVSYPGSSHRICVINTGTADDDWSIVLAVDRGYGDDEQL